MVAGWNAPNRLVVGRHVKPGQKIQLAVFGINGPLSSPPTNSSRCAARGSSSIPERPAPIAITPAEVNVDGRSGRTRRSTRSSGRTRRSGSSPRGSSSPRGRSGCPAEKALLFSDPNSNTIYRYVPRGAAPRRSSGRRAATPAPTSPSTASPARTASPSIAQGRLTIDQHGNRRVVRLEQRRRPRRSSPTGTEGKRLNSPNDLVYRSDGTLYFTDPPFGLPKFFDDPRKELTFSGVFALTPNGKLRLLADELTGPNGIAFSPDEKFLYVGNWDEKKKVVMRYPVRPDGARREGRASSST